MSLKDLFNKWFGKKEQAIPKPEVPKQEPKPVEPPVSQVPAVKPPQTPAQPEEGTKPHKGFLTMLSWMGKGENDNAFVKYISQYWGKVGLPGYKTIIGSKYAWCGLGMFVSLFINDLGGISNGAGARNWRHYGQGIEWTVNGVPRSAIMVINHAGNCSSSEGNHVTYANGDCKAEDLIEMKKVTSKDASGTVIVKYVPVVKKDATWDGLGGNQSNKVKVSTFKAMEICAVRWPPELPLPAKITKSINCTSNKQSGDTTR